MTTVALHVGQLLQPVPGGIGTYVRALLTHLPEQSVELSAFAAGTRPDGVTVPFTNLGWPHGTVRYEAWHRFRRPQLPVSDAVVHGPSLAVPPRRTRAGDAALVVTVHDVAFLRFPEFFTPRGVAFHRRGLALTYDEASVIITPSAFTRDELIAEGFEPERVIAIPHGMVPPAPPTPEAIAATRDHFAIPGPYLLVVGTVEPRKGLDTAAAAFRAVRQAHPKLRLVIAGPHGWNTVDGLDEEGIIRTGAVTDDQLEALYADAALCLVPSRYEGFGLPALEAMARGCAVIASDSSSLPEVVAEAGVLVPPGAVDAWIDAIRALLEDPNRRAALADAGRTRAATWSWTDAARAHADAYRQAAGAGRNGT